LSKAYLCLTVCERLSFTFTFTFAETPVPRQNITHTQRGRRAVSARAGIIYFLKFIALCNSFTFLGHYVYDCNNFEVATRAAGFGMAQVEV